MSLRDGAFPSKQSPVLARRLLRKARPEPVEGCARKDILRIAGKQPVDFESKLLYSIINSAYKRLHGKRSKDCEVNHDRNRA